MVKFIPTKRKIGWFKFIQNGKEFQYTGAGCHGNVILVMGQMVKAGAKITEIYYPTKPRKMKKAYISDYERFVGDKLR